MRPLLNLALFLVCSLSGCLGSQYDPHLPDAPAFFEGYYVRLLVTPSKVEHTLSPLPPPPSSVALIVGAMPRAPADKASYLVSLIVQNSSLAEPGPAVYTQTGVRLRISAAGGRQSVTANPDAASPPDFKVEAEDGSLLLHMSGNHCQLHAHFEGASFISHCIGPPLKWSPDGMGPEGPLWPLPASLTGLHWFVHSLATPMRFSLAQGSAHAIHGTALAHFEKNWGRSFPSTWTWAQGVNFSSVESSTAGSGGHSGDGWDGGNADVKTTSAGVDVRAAFALAGGKLPTPLVPEGWMPDLWLLGVRTRNYSWDFHPWDSVFTVQPMPCSHESTLLLTAAQPLTRRGAEVQIRARRNSYAELECPIREGFRPFSDESFTATATVRLYEYRFRRHERGWVQKLLVEAYEVDNVAVEFGGKARCPHTDATALANTAEESAAEMLAAA